MCDITRFWLSCFIAPKILYYLSILSVPDEGYSERHLMKVILSVPDEGYSRNALCALNLISTFFISYNGSSAIYVEHLNFYFRLLCV